MHDVTCDACVYWPDTMTQKQRLEWLLYLYVTIPVLVIFFYVTVYSTVCVLSVLNFSVGQTLTFSLKSIFFILGRQPNLSSFLAPFSMCVPLLFFWHFRNKTQINFRWGECSTHFEWQQSPVCLSKRVQHLRWRTQVKVDNNLIKENFLFQFNY